ncbi:MAG: DUF177 domain-containing protein [Rhodospirillales bacterium]|nr:DUF177 domain-containing protein [Rhodospirillales bacterium]
MQEELSYSVKASQIKDRSQEFTICANEAQRAALAMRFGIPAISRLDGRFTLHHERSGTIAASLAMNATATQVCVVTLEPFEAAIQEVVELRFVPEGALRYVLGDDNEADITPNTLDSPDEIPYADDIIDLGAALAEQLALALDPYPKRPGVTLPDSASDDSANPFAALAARLAKPS